MEVLRPGGLELTRYGLSQLRIPAGGRLLDIGCGKGEAALLAQTEFGLTVTAVDVDKDAVESAAARGLDARVMDASALEFPSRSFDIVMMECVFSALERQEESIHEAICMLRPGGALILSDVYHRNPDLNRWRQEAKQARALWRQPHKEGDCGKHDPLPSPYCLDGLPVIPGLQALLEELQMEITLFEDRTEDLKAFMGQAIFDSGSVEAWFRAQGGWIPDRLYNKDTGYFLLLEQKHA